MRGAADPDPGSSNADSCKDGHTSSDGNCNARPHSNADALPDASKCGAVLIQCLQGMGRGQVDARQNDIDGWNDRHTGDDA